MAKKLKRSVVLMDDQGVFHRYRAGDEVPASIAKKIENPHAWEEEDEEEFVDLSQASGSGGGSEDEENDFEKMTVPQLREYAKVNDLDLGEASKRDDILGVIREAQDAGD